MTGEKQTSPALYRMICALAAVACAFSLLVGILLIANSMAVSMASPLNLPELDHLRATLKASPADEAVRDKIRDLDQVVRHLYFTGLASGRTGVALLLAGITIALASLKFLAVLRRRQPDLRGIPPASDPLHEQSVTRWALAGVGILILAIIVSVGQVGRDLRARAGLSVQPRPCDGFPRANPWLFRRLHRLTKQVKGLLSRTASAARLLSSTSL